jgi:hypothetical protein
MQPSEVLADHFLRTAIIGAVFADADGRISVTDTVTVANRSGRIMFCCVRGQQNKVADFSRSLLPPECNQAAATATIREAAAELLIGLTAHETVVVRARAAVAKVEQTMADMQKSGALKAMNREFKAAREAGLASTYSAFVHGKKLALLEAMAGSR